MLRGATQLAVDRTRLAHERTLMAWVRTAASLISFGFAIDKCFERVADSEPHRWLNAHHSSLTMIWIAIGSLGLATWQHNRSFEDRLALRREHADSWVAEIHEECMLLRKTILPKSALGQAVTYTLNMWPKLRRCFDYAEVELSNNLAENSMRPVALGRKNWLHVGSAQSGPKVAAILSVVESCRRLGLPVKDYLQAVLPGMGRRNLFDLTHLTPARWAASRN